MLELGQLNCFVVVAEELSFRRAAVRLHMTQPPLSRQIQLLEHQMGVKLFTRSTRSVTLTAAGRAFLAQARQLLDLAQHATSNARRIAAGELGHLTFSFVSCAIYHYLPTLIHQMQQVYPEVALHLTEMPSRVQFNALRLRQVDLGVVREAPLPAGIHGRALLKEPFVLAIPAHHPLAHQTTVTLSCLHKQPFINYAASGWRPFHDLITLTLSRHGIEPRYVHSIGSTVAILSLVNGGLGLALVPARSADIRFDKVVFRTLPELDDVTSELLLVWHQENDNPVLPPLLDALYRGMQDVMQAPPAGIVA
ncbi:Transcriptional regulator, LysR family [Sodalis praecaptivus]|uniref:Transcriptional regulator, LysR family n=1 Tax=Sodalis praecaptivus TaxID=1239307 RepID=W0HXE6_9GAMM|nr:LysR substrate-binding domain-containing protein [Sodalis praecaptivus]AHF77192.1 Transcriptional regulator, LysR family [Sodalis praecaptivus]